LRGKSAFIYPGMPSPDFLTRPAGPVRAHSPLRSPSKAHSPSDASVSLVGDAWHVPAPATPPPAATAATTAATLALSLTNTQAPAWHDAEVPVLPSSPLLDAAARTPLALAGRTAGATLLTTWASSVPAATLPSTTPAAPAARRPFVAPDPLREEALEVDAEEPAMREWLGRHVGASAVDEVADEDTWGHTLVD
jgi:hypothetical protein